VAPLEASSLFGNLWRVYRNPRGLTSKLTKSAGCPKRVGKPGSERAALLHRSLLGVFPHIELTTSEVYLIRLQTRFNYFAILERDELCTLLCRTWKLKELCKKIKIRACKIIAECGKQTLNLTCIKILKVKFKHACEM
jgi:hypothetical protein